MTTETTKINWPFNGVMPVLVRNYDNEKWNIDVLHHFESEDKCFMCNNGNYLQCIPYKGNEEYLNMYDAPKEVYGIRGVYRNDFEVNSMKAKVVAAEIMDKCFDKSDNKYAEWDYDAVFGALCHVIGEFVMAWKRDGGNTRLDMYELVHSIQKNIDIVIENLVAQDGKSELNKIFSNGNDKD